MQQREQDCRDSELELQQRTEELDASQAALALDNEQAAKEQAVLVQGEHQELL